MKRKINRVQIFANETPISQEVVLHLTKKLKENNFTIVEKSPDLAIAVGGDGSFLRMVKKTKYNSEIIYVGINAGTLGFLQEIKIEDIDNFIEAITTNFYKIEKVGIQETQIVTNEKTSKYYSLNEIVIREKDLNTAALEIKIDNAYLESYFGDGILISTSVGSTAYNMSFGGSIVYNALHTLQITPVAPLNSRVYHGLTNSVIIPENIIVEIIPLKNKKNLLLSIDGVNLVFNDVKYIKTVVKNKRINCLRLDAYNFFEKINNKFLT